MQVKSVIYLTLAGVVFGVAATWLFIELADGVRRENDARKQALAAMQHKVTQHEEKASQDSLDAVAVTPDLAVFTLDGRRLAPATQRLNKGVYIRGGRKVVVK